MKDIKVRDLETKNLYIKVPTMTEQHKLWDILRDENVNKYYFPTPDRIFKKYNLSKENINDLKEARKYFMNEFNDWKRQEPFYEKKIKCINSGDNSQKFTWSIFTKDNEIIGQITVQPKDEYIDFKDIRDVGWFISPKYQGKGYATEAATKVLEYMFNEVEITKIITSAAIINPASWKIMERLDFIRTGEKTSTYFDENDNILKCYTYECNKEQFMNR